MKTYVDLSNSEKTSLNEKLFNNGIKCFEEDKKIYLEYKGKIIGQPQVYPEFNIKRSFGIDLT